MREVTSNKPWLGGSRDRRQSPRLACRGVLTAELRTFGDRVPIQNLSLSGFSLATPSRLEPDTLYHCALHPDEGAAIALLVQVARSDRVPGESGYVTAFKFSLYEADGRERLNELMARFARRIGFSQAAG